MSSSGVDASVVGRVFTGSPPYEVTRQAIVAFAGAVGATAPVHHDVRAARAAGFGDVVAPVTFAVVVAQRAEAEYVADPASGIDFSRVVHAEESFTHRRPIVAGDILTTAVHVDAIAERGGLALVTTRTEISAADDAVASVVSTLAVRGEGA